jgi:N-acetylglucosaminyldiphosphoundecaprenol N-acetyl-beta-D-mannosaminyltransferase
MNAAQFFTLVEHLYVGTFSDLQKAFPRWVSAGDLTTIFTPNPEQIMIAVREPAFFSQILRAKILLADGMQLVKVARQARDAQKVPNAPAERITGVDVVQWWLSFNGGSQGQRIPTILLGGKGHIAESLARKYDPDQLWCYGDSGYRDVRTPLEEEEKRIQWLVEKVRPRVIFVAFGAPYQERWVLEHEQWLQEIGVGVVLVCGGAFDVLSPASRLRRAPIWMQRSGLEWFFRLLQQPGRWRRQLEVLRFVWMSKKWVRR